MIELGYSLISLNAFTDIFLLLIATPNFIRSYPIEEYSPADTPLLLTNIGWARMYIRAERSEQEVSVKCTGCLISLTSTSAARAPKESKQAAQLSD